MFLPPIWIWKRGEPAPQSSSVTLSSADSCVTSESLRLAGSCSTTPLESSAVAAFETSATSFAVPSPASVAPPVNVTSAPHAGAATTSVRAAIAATRSRFTVLLPLRLRPVGTARFCARNPDQPDAKPVRIRLGRKDHFRTSSGPVRGKHELATQLVPDERSHDREAGAVGVRTDSGAVVDDRQHHILIALAQLDADAGAAVLERVLQELREHEREGGGTRASQEDLVE